MEPLDSAKNDESSGFSRRRISSILKAPRKSTIIPNPEQENVVECPKPVEKRNSRRVSFAPANDVLLFSNDVKNASPTRSPLQDSMTTAAATNNRVQTGLPEDGIQQIAGMETLLNAPLHASQHRDKVNFDVGGDFGEKTVMFSTDDAFMDMTQSQTIVIASDQEILADISLKNYDILPTGGEKTVMFAAGDGSMDITQSQTANIASGTLSQPTGTSAEKSSANSSVPCLIPDFENFLANLFKPSGPSVNPVTTHVTLPAGASSEGTNGASAHMRTPRADGDKENQAPTSLSAAMEKSMSSYGRIGDSSPGCALYPKDDESMDLTESQTGRIQGFADGDAPFQSLFPTQGASSLFDNRGSTGGRTPQPQGSKTLASFNPKDFTSFKNSTLHAPQQRHAVNLDAKDECREKTILLTAGDEFMDMTQSHTVNISCGSFAPAKLNRASATVDSTSSLQDGRREACGPHGSSANGMEPGFNHRRASAFKTSAPCGHPEIARVVPPSAASHQEIVNTSSYMSQRDTGDGKENRSLKTRICPANDVSMEMTEALTGPGSSGDPNLFGHMRQDTYPRCDSLTRAAMTPREKSGKAPGPFKSAGLETSLKPSLKTNVRTQQVKFGAEDDCRERTVRFTADEACMDVTRSHTVNIVRDLEMRPRQNVDFLPACGEKTVRFTADDADMDVTRCHTVNIATGLGSLPHHEVDHVPACGEKTVRFAAGDADMDVTRSLTANIFVGLDPSSRRNMDSLPARGEKTVRFAASEACMDMTQSHTVNIAAGLKPCSRQNVNLEPGCGEKTVRFTAKEACMDMTQSHTVDIATDLKLHSHQSMDALPACGEKTVRFDAKDAAMDVTKCHTVNIATGLGSQPYHKLDYLPACGEKTLRFDAKDAAMDVTQSHTVNIATDLKLHLHQNMDSLPAGGEKTVRFDAEMDMTQCLTANIAADPSDKTEVTPQRRDLKGVGITNHADDLDSNEADNGKEPEQRHQTSPSNAGDGVDAASSRKSRRASLANLQSKIRRLSHMINTVTTESCSAPSPQVGDKTKFLPVTEPQPELGCDKITGENTQAWCLIGGEQPLSSSTTPFDLNTGQLLSRLSVGGFKAKFPERSKPSNSKKATSAGEPTRTTAVNVTDRRGDFDADVSDIFDEELGSCEDMSEALDVRTPQKTADDTSPRPEVDMDGPLENNVFEEAPSSAVYGRQGSSPADGNHSEDEGRMEPSAETATGFEMGSQPRHAECDGNDSTAPCGTTQTTDDANSSQTASVRCEATFESTFKHSLFESQLEDYAGDLQRKFDDGSVTVLEFFKLFNIDFVIHNPRQSVRPENILSDAELTPMDLLKDRHVNHPKQMVYEKDVLALTEKVEGLKQRKRDLDKPLKIVNKPLWEDLRNLSEKELKSLGAKLKERNNLFRKTSKVLSHEMKEALYSNLVQANREEQQRLRGTIEEADEMLRSLDDCIHEVEAELAAVEEKGFENKPSLKSLQEELKTVNEALADNERQVTEMELQKSQSIGKVNRLKAETKILQSHVDALNLLSEWRFGESGDDGTVYTFLHETFHLRLVYEESNGKDVDNQSERKISQITFKHQLDAEKSQDHARLVHRLLARYVDGEAAWVEKYPTSRYLPKLLHDVSLVVGRCRLLGEELRLLKLWGGLKLNILSVSCVDTQVHIVFSSLKKLSKFEVILSVSLTNHLCVLQVASFKNVFGGTTIQQIDDIVASFDPGRNTLTKIIKKIHETLLC